MSGRKEPRTGGLIIATGSREAIEAALEQDPFKRHGLAEYTVTGFLPTTTTSELAPLEFTPLGAVRAPCNAGLHAIRILSLGA